MKAQDVFDALRKEEKNMKVMKWKCDAFTKKLVLERFRISFDHMKNANTMSDLDYYYGRGTGELGAVFVFAYAFSYGVYDAYSNVFLRLYCKKRDEIERR